MRVKRGERGGIGATVLAKWFVCTVAHVHRLTQDGVLKRVGGLYDHEVNVPAYIALLKKQRRRDSGSEEEFLRLRNIKIAADAKLSELRLREAQGELIDRAQVMRVMGMLLGNIKNHILAVPSRVSRLLVGLTSFRQVHDVLKRDHELVLREVSEFDMGQLGGPRGGISHGGKNGHGTKAAARRGRARRR